VVVEIVRDACVYRDVHITVPMGANGTWYVSAMKGLAIVSGEQYMLALDPSGTKSTYVGSETDGTMAFFLDYAP
jgi:hypothetical protein